MRGSRTKEARRELKDYLKGVESGEATLAVDVLAMLLGVSPKWVRNLRSTENQ